MKPLRVAFIAHYTSLYGANRSLLDLIDGLAPRGVAAFVIVPAEGELTAALDSRGVPWSALPFEYWCARRPADLPGSRLRRSVRFRREALDRFRANLQLLPRATQGLIGFRPDLIYSNSSVTPFGALAARRMRLPHVWHLREFGDLDYGLVPDWGARVHRRIIRTADALIAVSHAVRRHWSTDGGGRIRVVYNGVSPRAEIADGQCRGTGSGSPEGICTFGLFGLLHRAKGQEQAIRALHGLLEHGRAARLLLVGGDAGGEERRLRRLAGELTLAERVEFRGYVEDLRPVYSEVDVVLMCSATEAMGRVTVEAMAACRPVIGRNSGGTSEIIDHGITGLLYDGTDECLTRAMIRLMDDPELAAALARNGWRKARERYSIETYADSIWQILEPLGTRRS
jgi:glycosyltransferase involved in cell wall biosynthesis